jgi:Zn ribbon nucleic-acid-binding protein
MSHEAGEYCTACESDDMDVLGTLGNTTHYQCQDCGWQQSGPAEEHDDDTIDCVTDDDEGTEQ